MDETQPDQTGQLPTPATGLLRQWNRAILLALRVFPARLRRRLGWWDWDDIEGREYGDTMSLVRRSVLKRRGKEGSGSIPTPVHDLLRRGLLPARGAALSPGRFSDFGQAWSAEHWMELPEKEFQAWVQVSRLHPEGEGFLESLLEELCRKEHGKIEHVKRVIAAGANPSEAKGLIDAIFTGGPRFMEDALAIWDAVCQSVHPIPTWEDWAQQDPAPTPPKFTAYEMGLWRQSGLPMPTGKAALLYARSWLSPPALFFDDEAPPKPRGSDLLLDTHAAVKAVDWFKVHGDMPPHADTFLLAVWLAGAKIKDTDEARRAATIWLDELCIEGLPARPMRGPAWLPISVSPASDPDEPMPWSHWMAKCDYFENIPSHYRELLFSEKDAWTARNKWGEDTLDVYERRLKDLEKRSEGQGVEGMRAWVSSQSMHRQLPEVSEDVGQHLPVLPVRSKRF